ncbi:hypothetical protein LCGC14_0912260 [marine sediment metagenome]|uniref:Uncharacterized protein n=1 Tax=marine sediment metagenome TaxID=412755 RepID=A0A0F9NXV3_9ZZZZ
MKFRTPWQIHKYRKDKKELEFKIRDAGRRHQQTLEEHLRLELIALNMEYRYKYFKDYKG